MGGFADGGGGEGQDFFHALVLGRALGVVEDGDEPVDARVADGAVVAEEFGQTQLDLVRVG
ncbi:hypothetical protein GCM10020000_36150 [Streptomyces olivoverticillatus]